MKLRVATLNVWGLPDPVGYQVGPRLQALASHLPSLELDVLSLQEVWSAESRAQLVRAGRQAGLGYAWQRPGSFRDGGLLVLSRIPILSASFERYDLPGQPPVADHLDYYAGKGFLHVTLAGESGPVHVFDTHLHARYGSDVPHEYHTYRVGQIVQLALGMRATREPTIVTGDFNLRSNTEEYKILTGLGGLRDVAVELGRTDPTVYDAHPFRRTRRDRRIDYVFVRDGEGRAIRSDSVRRVFDEVFEIDGKPASFSDHAGVLANLELSTSPAAAPPAPDAEALRLASDSLVQGRARTQRGQLQARLAAGLGLGGALLATASVRDERVTRRRLLRASLRGAALLALAPGLGFSVLSEVYAPDELRAFEQLDARLAAWRGADHWIA